MGISKFVAITLLATALVASVESHGDCSFDYASYEGSQKKFNVILKDRTHAESHFNWLENCCDKSVRHISTVDFSEDHDENAAHDFSVKDAFYGYTAYFDPKFVENHLENHEDIELAEEDGVATIQHRHHRYNYHNRYRSTVRKNPTPNLDRIDQADFPLDGKYVFPATAGKDVTIYIVDTGILVTHEEFEGRARHGGSFCAGCPDTDDNGHGTHVAGIAAGKNFGVANKSKLVAVKVLNSEGSGLFSEIIAGLSFVLADHLASENKKSVVNLSLGGGKNEAANLAVKKLTDNGIHAAVAAGNDGEDDVKACDVSPASEPSAITVGATELDNNDVTNFSNTGECVDLFAPGRDIKSAGTESNNDTKVFSGTSQATPHVAGTVALIIAEFGNSSPAEMADRLNDIATKDIISENTLKGSPNVFLRVPGANKRHHYKNHHYSHHY